MCTPRRFPAGGISGGSTTAADLTFSQLNGSNTAYPISFELYINNVASTTIHKNVNTTFSGYDCSSNATFCGGVITGYWNSDTNAITGIEVTASGGNIASGTCSLYGMN